MRNLKRVLSLALALVMVLGLMVITGSAASAEFPDADDISYTEAVDVMNGLGILVGDENGNFNPTDILTREQAAKIICYILIGTEFADQLAGMGTGSYTDVTAERWSAGYIDYCTNVGIIAGNGDGTFDPNGELTGVAFAKMLLVALGNDAVAKGYVGTNWATNVAVDAFKTGLNLDGVRLTDPLNREQAAQMAFTALTYTEAGGTIYTVNGIEFDSVTDAAIYANLMGAPVVGPITTTTGSLADRVFGLASTSGTVTANGAIVAGQKTTTVDGAQYAVETGLDLIGHNVTVYYKKAASEPANGYTVYTVIDNSTTFEMTRNTRQEDLNAALGVSSDPATYSYTKYDGAYAPSAATESPVGNAGTAIIYNKTVIGFVEPTTYTLDKVTDIVTTAGSEAIKLNNGGDVLTLANNQTSDVVVEYDGIAKDDVVVSYQVGNITYLEKAQTLTGTPTELDGSKITIGGVIYNQAGTDKSGLTAVAPESMNFTDEYTLYLDANGNYFTATAKAGSGASTPTDLVYLVATYETTTDTTKDEFGVETPGKTSYWAQCVDMAGNQVIYQIVEEDATGSSALDVSGLYKVSTSYDNTLKANVANFDSADSNTVTTEIKTTDVKIADNHYFTSDVKFIYVKGEKSGLKVTVKDGVQAVNADISKEYVPEGEDDNKTVNYVIVEDTEYTAPTVGGTAILFAAETSPVTAKAPYTDDHGNTQTGYKHTVYIDGVKTTIITADANAINGFKNYTVSGELYTITDDNTASNLKAATAVRNMYNGLITTDDVADVSVTGATVVNLTSNNKVPTDPTALSDKDTVALVLSNDGKTVVTIYVTASDRG